MKETGAEPTFRLLFAKKSAADKMYYVTVTGTLAPEILSLDPRCRASVCLR